MSASGPAIVVVGTCNLDLALVTDHLPRSGETVLGDFSQSGGGKAANMAVAAARLGAAVHLVTRLGDDENASTLRDMLGGDGVALDAVTTVEGGVSGVAFILIDKSGDTMIGVAEGVNRFMEAGDVERSEALRRQDATVIVELGIPAEVVAKVCELRREVGFTLILNPAPYTTPLDDSLWSAFDVVTPNEVEAGQMTGIDVIDQDSALAAAARLREMGVGTSVVTLGRAGLVFATADDSGAVPAFPVQAVDTTGASDAFNGGLAVGLGSGLDLTAALTFGAAVAALSVTRSGAQDSMPTREEVDALRSQGRAGATGG